MQVWLVIPAYNEEANLGNVLAAAQDCGWNNIVVVDDASSDKTADVARSFKVYVLRHLINSGGPGAPLETGKQFALAQGADIVVFLDADGQHSPKDIARLIEPIVAGRADVVIGSRYLDKAAIQKIPVLKRYFLFPIARLIDWSFTGLRLTDVHNGWRILSRNAAQKIKLQQDGFAWATDFGEQVKKNNLRYEEVSTVIEYNRFGLGLRGGVKVVIDLFLKKIFN